MSQNHPLRVMYNFYILGKIGLRKHRRRRSDCSCRSSSIRVYTVSKDNCICLAHIFWKLYDIVKPYTKLLCFKDKYGNYWSVPVFRIFTVPDRFVPNFIVTHAISHHRQQFWKLIIPACLNTAAIITLNLDLQKKNTIRHRKWNWTPT